MEYALPLLGTERPATTREFDRIAATDASGIQPDIYYKAGQRWQSTGAIPFPGFDDSLGRLLSFFWPTDTPSGTAPSRSHPFTGLGAAPPWVTMWGLEFTNSTSPLYESFGKGHATSIEFVVDESGGPLLVNVEAIGELAAVVSSPSITTTDTFSASTYFRTVGAVLKFDEDSATPATQTNIQKFKLKVSRPTAPVSTADGVAVGYLAPGLVGFDGSMQLVWATWDGFKSSYYGSASGSAMSAVRVDGSIEMNWVGVGTNSATSTFKLSIPKVTMIFDPPKPNPDASPLVLNVNLQVNKPASGDHVVPTLVNNVTAGY